MFNVSAQIVIKKKREFCFLNFTVRPLGILSLKGSTVHSVDQRLSTGGQWAQLGLQLDSKVNIKNLTFENVTFISFYLECL